MRVFLLLTIFIFLYSFNAFDYQKSLGIGIDVNWALHKKEIKYYSKKEPLDFKKVGFNSVRIRFNLQKNHNINQIYKVVKDCLNSGLIVVLANSAQNFKKNPNNKNITELINEWVLIAKTFKNFPKEKLSYDLIIEPAKKLNKNIEKLNEFYKRVYTQIRKIDKEKIIMFAPTHCSNPYYLKYLWLPKNDKNIMIEWHMYAAGPSKKTKNKLWTNGNEKEKKLITDKIQIATNFSKKHNIPTWVGAWMPGNYNKGDNYSIKEQIKFATFFEKELAINNIPNAINADQQFYDYKNKKWREKRMLVLKAILKTFKNYWHP